MSSPNVAVLDVGSSKVCCIVARTHKNKSIEIIGCGYNASKGIRNGVITSISDATFSVCNAIDAAEQNANEHINNVILNISGDKTYSLLHKASIKLKHNRQINEADINKVMDVGLKGLPENVGKDELIHCLLTNYKIDGGDEVKDPRNIYADELSANMLLGMYPSAAFKNLSSVMDESHLSIDNKVFSAYASGLACLVEDEREYGATVIDIGGGTTSIATFKGGYPVAFSTLPVGGINITRDIALGLTTSFENAENLKIRYGCAFEISKDEDEVLNVYPVGEEDDGSIRQVPRSELIEIIKARVEEILAMVAHKLDALGLHDAPNHRIVLTGGGSLLYGIRPVAAMILNKQVRVSGPRNIGNVPDKLNNPIFSTALGMILFAMNNNERKSAKTMPNQNREGGFITKIFNWIRQNS